MPNNQRRNLVYGIGDDTIFMPPRPVVSQRAPTVRDRYEIGTIWIDQPNDDSYILTSITANDATWINAGGGTGVFNALTVTTTADIGTDLTVGGDAAVTGLVTVGTTLEVTGNTTLNTGVGLVQSSAAGLITASGGTDGQLMVGSTGLAPAWAAITSATLVITPGAGTLNIEESGGTANSYVTDVAGPVAPLVGVLDVLGGTNMTTDGTVANTITIDLDDDVTLAGFLSVADDITMLGGDLVVTADTDAAQTIYLHANGGTNETIDIHSDQGTGVSAIDIHADVGGIDIDSGLSTVDAINIVASDAAGGIDIDSGTGGVAIDSTGGISLEGANDCDFSVTGAGNNLVLDSDAGSVFITSDEAVADSIIIDATNAAGGIDVDCGTGGMSFVAGNGIIAFESGTADINVGVDAAAHTVTVGSVTGAADTVIQSGTGGVAINSTLGSTTVTATEDAADAIYLHANAGTNETIRLHADQGTGIDSVSLISDVGGITLDAGLAAANSIVIDASNAGGGIDVDCGTAGMDVLATGGSITMTSTENAADAIYLHANGGITETIHLLSTQGTAAAAIHLQALVGGVNLTSAVAGAASLTLVASDAAGGIDIDYGTGGMTIDATNGAFTLQTGTGAIGIGTDAAAKVVTIGSTTTTAQTIIQSGTGDVNVTSTDAITLDATGVIELNSTAAALGVGTDADDFGINIGTAGDRLITIGNGGGVNTLAVECGTGGAQFGATANAHATVLGSQTGAASTDVQGGTGGITIDAAGIVDMVPATDSQAAAAVTINANVGVGTFTGQTTASGAQATLTVTNSVCTVGSAILCSVSNLGANDARMTIERVTPGASCQLSRSSLWPQLL